MTAAKNTIEAQTELVAGAAALRSWTIALQTPPTEFYPKYGPLPAVVEVVGQPATWDVVGYTRTLRLSDGGSVVETITDSAPANFFAYDLSQFTGILGRLVSGGRAEWTFTPGGDGGSDASGGPGGMGPRGIGATTNIRWHYRFYALPKRAPLVRIIVSLFWAPYMKRVLATIVQTIEARG
ncbi:SRPBCC family protein [Agreia sp. COWG]|uniref:SRPBCC family protein n=1 Tax=Agreia sp. COWG TaxID=2773266 RepID=UPI001928424F|nr:SRPBCC family protein [Agreia sp. COWG]CAD5990534.1 Polyketide cyclase / dehydrase and lipid transport [Agreia sp. COWG]